jgi:hypothetical protein
MSETYLFVHIPKTAGTSFRVAVQQVFEDRVAYDYAKTPDTSAIVRQHVYEKRDLTALQRALESDRVVMLGGHVHYERYASIFPSERVITFVREPLSRVLSEHRHARRHNGFDGDLLEFASRPRNRNLQTSMLRGVELDQAALVGVTERYGDSLTVLESRIGWGIPELVRNINPERTELALSYPMTAEEEEQLREYNQQDLELYGAMVKQLEDAMSRLCDIATTSGVARGVLSYDGNGKAYGWALAPGARRPVRVTLLVDGAARATVVADQLRLDLREQNIHPSGNAGFECRVGELARGTVLRALIEGTDVELLNSPLTIE